MIVTPRPLHNQSIADDNTFVAHFVARRAMLEALLRRLRGADDEQIDLHRILIGPRGMGKTSLLRRIAIAINREPDLAARYVPLTFREEQYNVRRLGDFWRNCGEALAEWAEANGRDALARRIDRELAGHAWAGDRAGERFAAEIRALERRAVLLVDNLDLILDALNQPDDSDNWLLRGFLQQTGGPILIGASTKPLGRHVERDAAFYEFFVPDYLNPLDAAETEACMRALAAANGTNGNRVLATLNSQPERLKTLHTLTGGNPRVLALIYRLLETDETGAAMDDLALLLDQVTPYYKARIEEYTPAQRAILDGIALHWDPITIAQLSRETGTPTTTLSGQITRMINKDNVVEAVETSGSYSGYQFVERFFNIWYLMRHGTRRTKQKMRWLVEFLTSFYSAAELNDIARRAKMKGIDRHWTPEYSEAISEALSRCAVEKTVVAGPEGQAPKLDPMIRALIDRAAAAGEAGDYVATLSLYDQILAHMKSDAAQLWVPPILFNRAITLRNLRRSEEALADYDRLIALLEHPKRDKEKGLLARVLLNKSVIVGELRGPAEERAVLNALIEKFDTDPARQTTILRAMLNRAIVAGQMDDFGAAHAEHDAIAKRFGDSTNPKIADRVTQASFNRAILLFHEERWADAIAAFDVVRARVEHDPSNTSVYFVAGAAFHQASAFTELGEYEQAVAKFDEAIALLETRDEPQSHQRLALAFYSKAAMLMQKGDVDAAERNYTHLLATWEDSDNPSIRPIVANTLMDLAQIADARGDRVTEMARYDGLLSRFADDDDSPDLSPYIAQSMVNRALVLDEQADKAPVIAAYEEVIARFSETNAPLEREVVVSAMVNRAIALGEVGRYEEAIAEFDALVERFGKHPEPLMRKAAAQALFNKAIAHYSNGDIKGERATYRASLDLFGDDPAPDLDEPVVRAALQLGSDLEEEGKLDEAIAIYDKALGRFTDRGSDLSFEELTALRLHLALLLADTGIDSARAETLLREIEVREPVVGRVNRAWLALLRGDAAGAGAAALAAALDDLPDVGRALLTAGIELARGNFGLASEQAAIALEGSASEGRFVFSDDYIRLLRVAVDSGFGDRMLEWFEETGFAERFAPLYVAFRALVRGEATLRDASPEVAEPAGVILGRLLRRRAGSSGTAGGAPRERAGRKTGRTNKG